MNKPGSPNGAQTRARGQVRQVQAFDLHEVSHSPDPEVKVEDLSVDHESQTFMISHDQSRQLWKTP
ncbi:hypothetical protein BFW01_g572 [Lasiodiplodia theobromae]|nr:hypothetical protein BFW01_g572 [Lasiodiplodia theobromae]